MADFLDELGSGLKTVGQAALAVPQAIGGGALDILIGDRENVPVGEQIKRSIEALILAGDNPGNLAAVHAMNARRDAATAAVVGSPDFQDSMHVNQVVHDLNPMDAFQYTAKQYGVHDYAPSTQDVLTPVDLAPGGPSAIERANVTTPVLPPASKTDWVKHIDAGTAFDAYTKGDPLDQLTARYSGAHLTPPYGVQAAESNRMRADTESPGVTASDFKLTDGKLSTTVRTLPPDQMSFSNPDYAYAQKKKYDDVHIALGLPERLDVIPLPSGNVIVKQTTDEAQKAQATTLGTGSATDYLTGDVTGMRDPRYLDLPRPGVAPGAVPVPNQGTPPPAAGTAPAGSAPTGPLLGRMAREAAAKAAEDARKLAATNTDNFQKLNETIDLLQGKVTAAALPGENTTSLYDALKYKFSQDARGFVAAHGGQSYTPVQPLYELESTVNSLKIPLSRALGDKNVRFGPEMVQLVGQIFPNRYDTAGAEGTATRKLQTLRAAAQAIQTGTPVGAPWSDERDQWARGIVADTIAHSALDTAGTAAAPTAGRRGAPSAAATRLNNAFLAK